MANEFDPRLSLPPVVGVSYEDRSGSADDNEDDDAVILSNDDVATEIEFTDDYVAAGLLPPNNVTIISQTVKINSSGSASVDVVLEIEDVLGASEYESREAV